MDLEFFIYGAPKGNSYNGKEEEKLYFDSMYNGSSKINEIQIEIRKSGASQKMYCYYNYLIRQNVVDKNGRPGSFLDSHYEVMCIGWIFTIFTAYWILYTIHI